MSATEEPVVRAIEKWIALSLREALCRQLQSAREQGLSMSQIGLLFRAIPPSGGVFDLAQEIGVSGATASQMIDRLVQQGLLTRTESPRDRRVKQIALTSEGQKILRSFVVATRRWIEELTADLTPEEKELVAQAFEVLNRRMPQLPLPDKPVVDALDEEVEC